MNILWISDFSILHSPGGAQRSDEIIIKKGRQMGLNITHFTCDSDPELFKNSYDHVISANLELLNQKYPFIIDYLSSAKAHSRIEHDMNRYLSQSKRHQLYTSCKNAFFLTEYHYNLFKNHYGDYFINVRIVPDPIDSSIFFDNKNNREDKVLYVGFMHEFKGTFDFFRYAIDNPQIQFIVAGWGEKIFEHLATSIPNIEFLGKVSHEKMPELYNKYKTFIYFPRIDEPFCRAAGEAALSGMEMMINDKIGCIHEMKRLGMNDFINKCNTASFDFWNIITE
jgi:glycosyltransferase involved in cell wall biosynthesis